MPNDLRSPRIPLPLARRIDHLARLAHAFHRFAHHPLCDRYASELIPLGHRTRICRGCSLAVLGMGVGALMGALTRAQDLGLAIWLFPVFGAALALVPLGRSKLLRRLVPGLLLAFAVFHGPFLLSATGLFAGASLLGLYRRKGPNRGPCVACPQRTLEVCDGFKPIVRRERAFRRLTGRWLSGSGC